MGTLNQYAARIASLVNQPDNHELKERIKDMIKTGFANRIRQSVEKHGIDDILKLTYEAELEIEQKTENNITTTISAKTKNKVHTPIRVISDAPFMFVGSTDGKPYRYENSRTAAKCRQSGRATHTPTGSSISYFIDNGFIELSGDIGGLPKPSKIQITSIFENPDEVLAITCDGQDIELPFPNDMLENIIYEILKTEFNMYPRDIDIKVNSDTQTIGTKQSKE